MTLDDLLFKAEDFALVYMRMAGDPDPVSIAFEANHILREKLDDTGLLTAIEDYKCIAELAKAEANRLREMIEKAPVVCRYMGGLSWHPYPENPDQNDLESTGRIVDIKGIKDEG